MASEDEVKARYGASEHGNFAAVGTIAVPHPYMITAKHVAMAADHFGGMLGEPAIERAEKAGIKCGICKGKLSYKEHQSAVLLACKIDIKEPAQSEPGGELHTYLNKIKPLVEEDKYAGVAFMDDRAST